MCWSRSRIGSGKRESRFPIPNRNSACIRTFAGMLVCLSSSPDEPRLTHSIKGWVRAILEQTDDRHSWFACLRARLDFSGALQVTAWILALQGLFLGLMVLFYGRRSFWVLASVVGFVLGLWLASGFSANLPAWAQPCLPWHWASQARLLGSSPRAPSPPSSAASCWHCWAWRCPTVRGARSGCNG